MGPEEPPAKDGPTRTTISQGFPERPKATNLPVPQGITTPSTIDKVVQLRRSPHIPTMKRQLLAIFVIGVIGLAGAGLLMWIGVSLLLLPLWRVVCLGMFWFFFSLGVMAWMVRRKKTAVVLFVIACILFLFGFQVLPML